MGCGMDGSEEKRRDFGRAAVPVQSKTLDWEEAPWPWKSRSISEQALDARAWPRRRRRASPGQPWRMDLATAQSGGPMGRGGEGRGRGAWAEVMGDAEI